MRGKALISKIDTVLTSVGAMSTPVSTFHGELVKQSGLKVGELKELTYGDVGGASLERAGLDAESHRQFERVANMWMGITPEDLQSVVKRAAGSKKPGVIIVTFGKHKARIVFEAVRRGLVSELFIDQDLAFSLLELCQNPPED